MNSGNSIDAFLFCWRRIIICMISVLVLSCGAESNTNPNSGNPLPPPGEEVVDADIDEQRIEYETQDAYLTYGEYSEFQLEAFGLGDSGITWSLVNDDLPVGLFLDDTGASTLVLFGTPEFTGEWCFGITAESGSVEDENLRFASAEVCLFSEENDSLRYPRFQKGKYLEDAVVGQSYFSEIFVEAEPYRGTVHSSDLPDPISVVSRWERFEISGRFQLRAVHRFVLKVLDTESGLANYRQFQIAVNDDDEDGGYQCPPGYYYDEELGHCVQDDLETCPDGTFYDPDTRSCVAYPEPPVVRCPVDSYWDHYLGRCVYIGAPRCPHNYRWSRWKNRCVRRAYTCGIGWRWSHVYYQCVPIYRDRSCRRGERWDSYYRRCVPAPRYCRSGYRWSNRDLRCVPTRRSCRRGEHWNPRRNRCVVRPDRPRYCGPRERWNGRRCERRVPRDRRCGRGQHYDRRAGRCIPNRRPPRMMPPRMMPPRMMPPMPPRMMPPMPPRMMPPMPPRMMPPMPPRMMPPMPPRMMPPMPPRMMPPMPPRMMPPMPPRMMPPMPPRMTPMPPRMMPPRMTPMPPRMMPPRMMPPRMMPPRMMPRSQPPLMQEAE